MHAWVEGEAFVNADYDVWQSFESIIAWILFFVVSRDIA